jgi:chromosome segregation ATPase
VTEQRRRGAPGPGARYRDRLQQHAVLRDRVGHHLSTVEQVIQKLQRDVAAYREENHSLAAECARLHQQLERADQLQADQAQSESRWRETRSAYEREARARESLDRDHVALSARCRELEEALAVCEQERGLLSTEVQYLQAQVEELQTIIDLLAAEATAGGDGGEG